jgi:hypothetical protein
MKNVVSAMFIACAVSVAVSVAAQEPATQSPQSGVTQQPATGSQQPATDAAPVGTAGQRSTEQRSSTAAQRPAQEKVTISGCIENAPAPAGGAAASASGPKYLLSNAKMSSAASSAAVGTAGTASAATQYRLDGEDKTISPHVSHQVEITGTVQTSSASATGAANAAPGAAAAGPMLKVDSLKMVSATCQK